MNLLSRLEKLERETPGDGADHVIMFPHTDGEDESAEQAAALAHYKAEHLTNPSDVFQFIIMRPTHPHPRQEMQ